MQGDFCGLGWASFPGEPCVRAWSAAAWASVRHSLDGPWRHGETWLPGVDLLANDPGGAVPGGPPLCGMAVAATGWRGPWHRAQVSVVREGYPRRDPDETAAAHAFRRDRDAAHLDGLLPEGPARRRHLREPHAFVLGLPLTEADAGAAPLTVWEGSHRLMRAGFAEAFAGLEPDRWGDVDVTDLYATARREVFARCRRIELPGRPGEAVVLHRHTLHGVAPWACGARAAAAGRAVAYFRPICAQVCDWMADP